MTTAFPKPEKSVRPRRRIARTSRPPRQSRSRAAVARRKADAAWSRDVRAFGFCERCDLLKSGYVTLDAHHIWGKKAHPSLRHERDNGVALCRKHHQEAHAQPLAFRGWFANAYPMSWSRLQSLLSEAS